MFTGNVGDIQIAVWLQFCYVTKSPEVINFFCVASLWDLSKSASTLKTQAPMTTFLVIKIPNNEQQININE